MQGPIQEENLVGGRRLHCIPCFPCCCELAALPCRLAARRLTRLMSLPLARRGEPPDTQLPQADKAEPARDTAPHPHVARPPRAGAPCPRTARQPHGLAAVARPHVAQAARVLGLRPPPPPLRSCVRFGGVLAVWGLWAVAAGSVLKLNRE
jgi:hypothetical protein